MEIIYRLVLPFLLKLVFVISAILVSAGFRAGIAVCYYF